MVIMVITKLERIRGQQLRVYLNDEAVFCLRQEDLTDYPLQEGQELDETLRSRIYAELLARRAKLKCLEMLERSDRTSMELRRTLKRAEFPEEVVQAAIDYAKECRYLDDRRYANHYVERNAGRKSRREMKAALMQKGISDEEMEDAFSQCTAEAEEELVRHWIRKRHFDPDSAAREERIRFMAAMARHGISYGTVQRVLDKGV